MTTRTTQWVPVLEGALALGPRPKKTAFKVLKQEGATAVLTLLTEHEGATALGELAKAEGLTWVWLPLAGGDPPPVARDADIRAAFLEVRAALAAGGKVFVHCSAGIHRTGMMAFGLLRFLGLDAAQARLLLTHLRAVTAAGVGDERLSWGEAFALR
jgi:protein-tyrosine phosphatase